MDLTKNQQLAIDIRDANVLVSAAAGSGKTSVLTERIVSRITDTKEPVDIDRLLVMTFTNAAAAEMQERIRNTIEDRLDEMRKRPDADPSLLSDLERQSALVHSAMITTIHGFCKSVITDHFEELSLDPDFRVADDNECRLIMQDALDECMENAYEKGDPGFFAAVECYSKAGSDAGIADLVIPIYRYVIADPDPEEYVKKCCRYYNCGSFEEFTASPLVDVLRERVNEIINMAKVSADLALCIIDDHEELEPYRSNLDAYESILDRLKNAAEGGSDFADKVRQELVGFSHPRLAGIRFAGVDDGIKQAGEEVKQLRDTVKARLARILDLIPFDMRTCYEHVRSAEAPLYGLAELVIEFMHIYGRKKQEAGLIDFNDMEHMAIRVLRDPGIAEIYREQYIEIYVDEYQDSNMTQEMLISLIKRTDPGNVFQVGDVKQSIYRFREACPDLFLAKYRAYTDEPSPDRRILLNDNFRSRRQTVDAVNEVFTKIMTERLGGIEYGEEAKLTFGATYYTNEVPCEGESYKAEIIIGKNPEKGEERLLSKDEFLANIIADRINGMIRSNFLIYDKAKKLMRPVTYGDFVILCRSVRKVEAVFREVFAGAGIPLAVSGREGYFAAVEVQTALAFLQAIDNPLCDIPLATLMRSPVGGFSDVDLAKIRAHAGKEKCLYDMLRAVVGPCENTDGHIRGKESGMVSSELYDKCVRLLGLIVRYRQMSHYTPVHGILSDFIDREYADHVRCMSKGRQRMANLSMLLVKAENFGKTSFKGLYQFVRYMDQIQKYEIDDGEAGTESENDDVVRMMTIHSSKGLEFPVCIIAGIDKQMNMTDERGNLIYNSTYGFGTIFADPGRRIFGQTLPKILIKDMNKREDLAEEVRLLYVAMTRARDKLIMAGISSGDCFEKSERMTEDCISYLDLLRCAAGADGFKHIDVMFKDESDVINDRVEEQLEKESAADDILSVVREHVKRAGNTSENKGTKGELPSYLRRLSFRYPYPLNPDLRAKLSVSDLKHRAIEEEIARGLELAPEGEQLFAETEPDKYIPKFMRGEGQTEKGGTFYGSAFHRIMELWDYSYMHACEVPDKADTNRHEKNSDPSQDPVTSEDVRAFADKMYGLHRMSKDQVDAIRPDDVTHFLNSALGIQMKHAANDHRLYREQPFVIGISEGGETVLVQGIIDAYFIEDDGITIVDYKTDRVSDEEMLINRYRAQLEYYGIALSQIIGRPVRRLTIYSTRLRSRIDIPPRDDQKDMGERQRLRAE